MEVNREEQLGAGPAGDRPRRIQQAACQADLMFGPDPSSGDMCKLGGMLANNSSGPHTLRYGSVKDNVHSLRVCLQSGEWLDATATGWSIRHANDLLTAYQALRKLLTLVREHKAFIRGKQPSVSKNSCGYNLFGLADGLDRRLFDLPKLFVGSEGTLGVISEAKVRLAVKPARRR